MTPIDGLKPTQVLDTADIFILRRAGVDYRMTAQALVNALAPLISWDNLSIDDLQPSFALTFASETAALVEVGTTLTAPAFNATYTQTPVTAVLTDSRGTPPKNVIGNPSFFTSDATSVIGAPGASWTFTLTATSSRDVQKSASQTVTAAQLQYWGVGAPGGATQAFIKALTGQGLSLARGRSFSINAAAGQKAYFAHRAALGEASFNVGGFEGGFLNPIIVSVANSKGFTEDYHLYESFTAGLGPVDVTVS